MSPRNWPDLAHGCKLSQLETTVQPIIHSGQHQVSRPSDRDQIPVGVPSCSSCLPSGVTLYWFSWAYLFLQEQQPNRLLQTLPKGCDFTDVHVSIHVIPSSDLVGSGRRKEGELGEDLDKSKPQPWALSLLFSPCSPELAVGAAQPCVHVCHDILCILSEGTKTEGWVSSATSNLTKVRFLWVFVFIFVS